MNQNWLLLCQHVEKVRYAAGKAKRESDHLPSGVKLFSVQMLFPYLFTTVRYKHPVDMFSEAQSRKAVVPCDLKATCSNYSSSICITQMSQACILETNTKIEQSPGLVLVYVFQVYLGSPCCPKGHQTGAVDSKESVFPAVKGSTHGLFLSLRHTTPSREWRCSAPKPGKLLASPDPLSVTEN